MKNKINNTYFYRRSAFGKSSNPFALVSINGYEISKKYSISVKIHQKMLMHTEYVLTIPSEAFNDKNSYPMENSQKLLGTDITIKILQHGETMSLFTGQVTSIEYKRANKYPLIIIYGKSYTILLDAFPGNRTYQNMNLESILNEVKKEYTGNKIDFIIAPEKQEIIPYTVSYNETAYEFMQRLAKRYGEYFFWNGSQLVFGRGFQYSTQLKEGRDFLEYSIKAYTQKQYLSYNNYYPQIADQQSLKSSDVNEVSLKHIVNPFQNNSVEASLNIFQEPENSSYFDGLSEEESYFQLQKIKAHQDSLQNLVTVEAKTTNPRLRLGDIAQLLASIRDINIKSFKEEGVPIESYLIQEININYSDKGYRNSFNGIPREQKTAPYWDINAFPNSPDQIAVVVDNNDPLQMNRVKLKFPWQKVGETTPWIRLLQGYSGPDRGMHIIPEQGEEVMVSFRGGNAEVPVVTGSLYNGKHKSGYHTSDNRIKAFKTRDGEKLEMEGLKNIVLSDIKGNKFHIDIEKNTINIKALDIINLEAQYINMKAEKDITVKVGNNMKTNVYGNYDLDTGKNTIIASNNNTYVSARRDMDIYGGKKVIGFSSGITEWGAASQMHIHGANSKITALNKLEYKSPYIDELPQTENFLYNKEPQIVDAKWVSAEDFETKIKYFKNNQEVGILVHTRNYNPGEKIEINAFSENGEIIKDGAANIKLNGTVDEDGFARIRFTPEIEEKKELKKTESVKNSDNLTDHSSYKSYKRKNFTKDERETSKQEQFEMYAKNQNISTSSSPTKDNGFKSKFLFDD